MKKSRSIVPGDPFKGLQTSSTKSLRLPSTVESSARLSVFYLPQCCPFMDHIRSFSEKLCHCRQLRGYCPYPPTMGDYCPDGSHYVVCTEPASYKSVTKSMFAFPQPALSSPLQSPPSFFASRPLLSPIHSRYRNVPRRLFHSLRLRALFRSGLRRTGTHYRHNRRC